MRLIRIPHRIFITSFCDEITGWIERILINGERGKKTSVPHNISNNFKTINRANDDKVLTNQTYKNYINFNMLLN